MFDKKTVNRILKVKVIYCFRVLDLQQKTIFYESRHHHVREFTMDIKSFSHGHTW